jgi:hypothetical protein
MDARKPSSLVHYFDPILHSVPCGSPGFSEPSTKHARGVTCRECVAFLRTRAASPAAARVPGGDAHVW